jgi:hypothetical protein
VRLLEIQSSPRGESSDSIALTKSFIEACKSYNNSIVVDTLNVWHESLPEFDYEAIGAKYKAVKHETMTEAESNIWARIQLLIHRFQNADRILLVQSAPPPTRFKRRRKDWNWRSIDQDVGNPGRGFEFSLELFARVRALDRRR